MLRRLGMCRYEERKQGRRRKHYRPIETSDVSRDPQNKII